jgi:hypothetical protein
VEAVEEQLGAVSSGLSCPGNRLNGPISTVAAEWVDGSVHQGPPPSIVLSVNAALV